MDNLLKIALPKHYGLNRKSVKILKEITEKGYFDLSDQADTMIVSYSDGFSSYKNRHLIAISVLNYEKYISQFDNISFGRGRRRCDFILTNEIDGKDNIFILNELTSSSSLDALSKPIYDKDRNVIFPKGKFQKAEIQLVISLQTLMDVPEIKAYADTCAKRVCLLSYRIDNGNDPSGSQKAFNRYKTIESKATGSEGALLHQAVIESFGFEYRRISYEHSYAL